MKRKTSRREFLKGKSAADAMAHAIEGVLPGVDSSGPAARDSGEAYMVRIARRAMACRFEVRFGAGRYDRGTELAVEALDLVDALEDQMSVFRETSDICRINRTAGSEAVEVEQRLFELLELAVRLHRETGGAFDITSAPLWEVWGFARRSGTLPNEEQLAEALQNVGCQLIELDARHKTIRFRRPGVQLSLGSIGKGYALDRCAEKLVPAGITDVLIHGGHSSVLAHGAQTPSPAGSPGSISTGWLVGIRHPLRRKKRLAEIRLCDRALATSGGRAQSFVHKGRRYGHILDPRTGRPAEGVLSATAIAPTGAMADALSTTFYVMGPQKTLDYCQTRPEIAAVLVCPTQHNDHIKIHTAGLAEDELTIL